MNLTILSGNVGAQPEIKTFETGKQVANFTFATTESYKDKSGEWQNITEWHRISAFGKLAEIIEKIVNKGDYLEIQGKIKTRSYEDKDGKKVYVTEIIADKIDKKNFKKKESNEQKDEDDEIPF